MTMSKIFIAGGSSHCASSTAVAAPLAHADGKNEVRAVTFDEDGGNGITRVHVRGAQTPTFTVYKLERPSRVVIDLPQAKLADVLKGHESGAMFTPSTWAVSAIAAQQLDDGAVRVIVTLARPGRYDVKTDGNEVVVMIMPRDPAPKTANPAELARVQAECDEARQQAKVAEAARAAAQQQADAASATAKQSRTEAEAAKAEADRLRTMAAEQATKAAAAQRAVDQARQLSAADLERAKAVAAQARDSMPRPQAARRRARRRKPSGRASPPMRRSKRVAMRSPRPIVRAPRPRGSATRCSARRSRRSRRSRRRAPRPRRRSRRRGPRRISRRPTPRERGPRPRRPRPMRCSEATRWPRHGARPRRLVATRSAHRPTRSSKPLPRSRR